MPLLAISPISRFIQTELIFITRKVPHPSYSGLEAFPTVASNSARGPVTTSLEPRHHQGAFDTNRKDVFRYFHVNSSLTQLLERFLATVCQKWGWKCLRGAVLPSEVSTSQLLFF